MPVYEYRCDECKTVIERTKKITDKSDVKCSECGAVLQKCLSRGSFVLKGPCWGKDGYTKP